MLESISLNRHQGYLGASPTSPQLHQLPAALLLFYTMMDNVHFLEVVFLAEDTFNIFLQIFKQKLIAILFKPGERQASEDLINSLKCPRLPILFMSQHNHLIFFFIPVIDFLIVFVHPPLIYYQNNNTIL